MRVMITGADGFVGTHLQSALHENGHDVFPLGGPAAPYGEGFDVTDSASVVRIVKRVRPEVIIHLAAQSSVARSWASPAQTAEINMVGSLHLWSAAHLLAVPRFIYASTAEVYQPASNGERLGEEFPLRPNNPYGVSKHMTEVLLGQLRGVSKISLVIVRPFNHIGPGQQPGFVVPDIARQIAEVRQGVRSQVVVGNLSPFRDFLDVRDVARAYVLLIERPDLEGIFNLCSGTARSIRSVAEDLLRLGGLDSRVLQVDPLKSRPADQPWLVGQPDKLHRASGWQPAVQWEQTLRDILSSSK